METKQDIFFLKKILTLAKKGLSWTFPNPMVGALIVKNGKIIAKGYHKRAGLPHAEIEALQHAKEDVRGATLYINLEPCIHFGKTPPCVDAIVAAGIARVVCCTVDPNPKVKLLGIKKLHEAGIAVSVGLLEYEARQLNEAFFTFHEKKHSFVAIKFAASLDGKIATFTGDSQWITNQKAREFARKLRSEHQAVLVGINTVLKDNPHLGVRIRGKKDPLRIILDSTLKIPMDSQILRDKDVLIVTTVQADQKKKNALKEKGIELIIFKNIHLRELFKELKKREIISVFVEGGSQVLGSFVDNKMVDKLYAFHAPILIGGNKSISAIAGQGAKIISDAMHVKKISFKQFDDNMVISGYV